MRQLYSWFVGFGIGAAVSAVLVTLFVPETSSEIRQRIKDGYRETLEEARRAGAARRAELEAELRGIRK